MQEKIIRPKAKFPHSGLRLGILTRSHSCLIDERAQSCLPLCGFKVSSTMPANTGPGLHTPLVPLEDAAAFDQN